MRSDARKAMQEKRLAEQQVAASGGVDELARLLERLLNEEYGDEGWRDLGSLGRIARAIAREWLPERERAASEKAWDEGLAAWRTYLNGGQVPLNPYRERADREEQGDE